ncbi:mediator of RNA polymerase II transcription subunit 26 [Cloeon dipterum]|uniref:mediator of RNA polymerase II transcription subunit 26 n=1 Tax=Cloeon dipterum TaxID=197152 RepID=UPI00321FB615
MQHSPSEIRDRLLNALDADYNVTDMRALLEVITTLENTPITKELLEVTRIGKYINDFRRKTQNEALAKRAKDLLRRWRKMLMPAGGHAASAAPVEPLSTQNGTNSTNMTGPGGPNRSCRSTLTSPAVSNSSSSPGLRRVSSLPSSPQLSARVASPRLEPVNRTHASNKRLRKENMDTDPASGPTPGKQQRVNGCCTKESASISPLVPTLDLVKKSKNSSSSASSSASTNQVPPPSASTSSLVADTDIVKANMSQLGRGVKTTRELLHDLKHRDAGGSAAPSTDADDYRRSKTEHLAKFLNSQAEGELPVAPVKLKFQPAPVVSAAPSKLDKPPKSPTSRMIAEIMSRLPPIDPSCLLKDDEEDEPPDTPIPPEQLVEKVLASEPLPGVTGNVEEAGDDKTAFKEWHQPVWRHSYEPLLVWPYVITD